MTKDTRIRSVVGALAGLALACAASLPAQAALITIPQSALSPSPGVYTTGGYYTTDLGSNIVTTGGGNAANVGQADGRNDDGFMALALGFDIGFYGTTYNSLFINNNGNVSFNAGISAYVPTGPTGASAPVISPFFGDVDTRASGSGVVYYNLQDDQLVVTWDEVGYYSVNDDALNSFQLVLRGNSFVVPEGEGSIGFFYQTMGWEVTDTSTVAAVGFGDGAGNGNVLAGSVLPGLNTAVENQYLWFNRNLTPVNPVPAPGSLVLLLMGILSLLFFLRRAHA